LTADTHLSPLHVSATLQDVGVQRLTDVVNEGGLDGLVGGGEGGGRGGGGGWVRRGARVPRGGVRSIAWRTLLAATIGGTALAALVYRRRWHRVAAGGGGAGVGGGVRGGV